VNRHGVGVSLRPTACCDCWYTVGDHGAGVGFAGWLGFGWAFGLGGWSGFEVLPRLPPRWRSAAGLPPMKCLRKGWSGTRLEVPGLVGRGPVPARSGGGDGTSTRSGCTDRVGNSAISLEPATAPERLSTGVGDAKVTGHSTRPPYSFFFGTGPARPAPATWCQVLEMPARQALPGEPTRNRMSGSLGEFHPQAPTDPGVTVSRYRALLIQSLERGRPGPVFEQPGFVSGDPFPPGQGLLVRS
jgi:hypothetical protein